MARTAMSTTHLRANCFLLGAIALAAVPACMVHAQSAASSTVAESSSSGTGLEEITVTARRKEENLQQVPVVVEAFNAAQIQNYDLNNLEKISTLTPDFTIGRSSNGSGAQLTLRGIGSSSTSIGIEQSVAVVLDGVYYGQGRVINEGFVDLADIEVLKGPQALYFGKNATAGVISLRSADPTSDPEFMTKLGYEEKAEQIFGQAMASGPLSDTVSARIAVSASNMFGGYFSNGGITKNYPTTDVAPGPNFGTVTNHIAPALNSAEPGEDEYFGRLTLQYKPTDRLKATLKINGSSSHDENNSWNYVPYGCAGGTFQLNPSIHCGRNFTVYQNFFPADLAGSMPYSRDDGGLYNEYRSYAFTGTIDYKFDHANATVIANYNRNLNQWACDCTLVSSDLSAAPSTEHSVYDASSLEARAQSTFDGPINVMAGIYLQKTHRNHTQAGATAGVEDSDEPAIFRYLAYYKRSETWGQTGSGYGQLSWTIVPTLEFDAGARFIHETKTSYLVLPYVNPALATLFIPNKPITADQDWNNMSPEATLSWRPTSDVTVYGAYKTAYKSGGFSNSAFVTNLSTAGTIAFQPERARGFEAGVKTTLLDHQLRLNLDLYTYKYVDLQVDYFDSQTFEFITTNAGSARTTGFEIDSEFAPRSLTGVTFHGSINYNRARYIDYIAPCYGGQSIAAGCNLVVGGRLSQNLGGAALAVAPLVTASLGANYDFPPQGRWEPGLSFDSRYSGSYLASGFANPYSLENRYMTLNATARVRTSDDRWEFEILGRNLTNRFIVGGAVDAPSTGAGTGTANAKPADELGFVSPPRTVQIQATARF